MPILPDKVVPGEPARAQTINAILAWLKRNPAHLGAGINTVPSSSGSVAATLAKNLQWTTPCFVSVRSHEVPTPAQGLTYTLVMPQLGVSVPDVGLDQRIVNVQRGFLPTALLEPAEVWTPGRDLTTDQAWRAFGVAHLIWNVIDTPAVYYELKGEVLARRLCGGGAGAGAGAGSGDGSDDGGSTG